MLQGAFRQANGSYTEWLKIPAGESLNTVGFVTGVSGFRGSVDNVVVQEVGLVGVAPGGNPALIPSPANSITLAENSFVTLPGQQLGAQPAISITRMNSGPELLDNPLFTIDLNGWATAGNGTAIWLPEGKARLDSTSAGLTGIYFSQDIPGIVGARYQIVVKVDSNNAGNDWFLYAGSPASLSSDLNQMMARTTGLFAVEFNNTQGVNETFNLFVSNAGSATAVLDIDYISIRQVLQLAGHIAVTVQGATSATQASQTSVPGPSLAANNALSLSILESPTVPGVLPFTPDNLVSTTLTGQPAVGIQFPTWFKAPTNHLIGGFIVTNPGTVIYKGDYYIKTYQGE